MRRTLVASAVLVGLSLAGLLGYTLRNARGAEPIPSGNFQGKGTYLYSTMDPEDEGVKAKGSASLFLSITGNSVDASFSYPNGSLGGGFGLTGTTGNGVVSLRNDDIGTVLIGKLTGTSPHRTLQGTAVKASVSSTVLWTFKLKETVIE